MKPLREISEKELVSNIIGAFKQFEHDVRSERIREGLRKRKEKLNK